MKSIKYLTLLLGVGALTLSSCNDFLDQLPDERTQIDNETKVKQLLIASYPSANYGWICEISSDNIMDNNAQHLPISSSSEQISARYNLGSYGRQDDELYRFEPCVSSDNQDTPSYLWSSFYEGIISANYALDGIQSIYEETGEMTESMKHSRAEALLIRAYCHFILVNVFSQAYKDPEASKLDQGVPYVDNTETVTDFQHQYDRGTVAGVYEKIEKDLLEGLKDVSDADYDAIKYHFNVEAAHAFAARFYLFKRDYAKVIEHANAVLTTDPTQMASKLMKYDGFGDCTYMDDYLQIFNDPTSPNNLFLLNTMSLVARHGLGYRYANNSTRIREIYYHMTPWNGRYYAYPMVWQAGYTFWTGRDYGYFPAKAGEEFEYTDKLAGIGYVHTIRREFTCSMLLLERAEAEAMLGKYADAAADLIAYNHSLISFSEAEAQSAAAVGVRDMTQADIDSYFGTPMRNETDYGKVNCFENWDFTQNMSSSFVVPQEAVKYMNAVNEFRRIERLFDGDRFFDLKRWGIEYSHVYGNYNHAFEGEGSDQDEITYTMTWNDPRRAIEVPQDAIQAGLTPSRPIINEPNGTSYTKAYPYEGYFSKD
ncbi:MAG: RagB/SusD family nutrient uptake outer membrane protein [Prevotella sp.]|nr:RagB/SusD family nutrient uptake outer membrane protein [Prevotella sp.]